MSHFELSVYQNNRLEGDSYLEIMVAAFFKMAYLTNGIFIALQEKDDEKVFHQSERVREILTLLEAQLAAEEKKGLEDLIGFCKLASMCLTKIIIKADEKLAQELSASFKKLGQEFQEFLQKKGSEKRGPT